MSYQQDVVKAFEQFACCWSCWKYDDKKASFWHVANSLDAAVDFLIRASTAWGDKSQQETVQSMIANAYQIFGDVYSEQEKQGFRPGMWWDDFGWWGIVFLKIYDNFDLMWDGPNVSGANDAPVTRAGCLDVATACWQVMDTYAWGKANEAAEPPLAGPVSGGCWNNYPEAGGIQNSVTNGLFLTLSIRLFLTTMDAACLMSAWNEFLWFKAWYARNDQLFKRLDLEGSLLLAAERPHDPENSDYNAGNLVPYVPGQMWTGDQGLLLGGLTGLLQAQNAIAAQSLAKQDPSFPGDVRGVAQAIGNGMTWLYDSDNVLHEATLKDEFGSLQGFLVDYATGKGVFSRYLAYAQQKLKLSCAPYIVPTAKAALQYGYRQVDDDGISLRWSSEADTKLGTNDTTLTIPICNIVGQITLQSSRLDGLNAAIPVLK